MALPIAVAVFFGVFMPYGQGLNFLNPWQMLLFTGGPALFAAGKGRQYAVRAWALGLGVYGLDLLYVSATHWHGRLLLPDPVFAFSAALFGLSAGILAGSLPQRVVRIAGAFLLAATILWPTTAPAAWRDQAALLLVSRWLPLYTLLFFAVVLYFGNEHHRARAPNRSS